MDVSDVLKAAFAFDSFDGRRRYMRPPRRYRPYFGHGDGGALRRLLRNKQFDAVMVLLCVAMALQVLSQKLPVAPVTSCAILFFICLHFEDAIRGSTLLNNANDRYSFQAAAIIKDNETFRIFTGQVLHDNKFHLYLTMTALVTLCSIEVNSSLPSPAYLVFMGGLTAVVGILHAFVIQKWQPSEMYYNRVGFSGVVFALKAFQSFYLSGNSYLSIPIFGDLFHYDISSLPTFGHYYYDYIPLAVPAQTLPVIELFVVSIIFPRSDFWGHLSGIAAGYLFVVADLVFGSFNPWERKRADSSMWQLPHGLSEVGSGWITLFVIAATAVLLKFYFPMSEPHVAERAGTTRETNSQNACHAGLSVLGESPDEDYYTVPVNKDSAKDKPASNLADAKPTRNTDESSEETDEAEDGEPATLTNQIVGADNDEGTPSSVESKYSDFDDALKAIVSINKNKSKVAKALALIRKLIVNATTLQDDKYRRVSLSNPHIAKCMDLHGALELLLSVGFFLDDQDQDKEETLCLKYPYDECSPSWLNDGLKQMEHHEEEIKHREANRKARNAALARHEAYKVKRKKSRRTVGSGYSAGLGGGDSRSVFYSNGT